MIILDLITSQQQMIEKRILWILLLWSQNK